MRTLEPYLEGHPFLRGLAPEYIKLIVGCASNVRFNPGEVIFREGEEANRFYLIRQGNVALEIYAPGRGPINIQTLGAGHVLGWAWLIPPYHWHFDAIAVDLTRAIALDGKCLRTKCDEDAHLGYELMKRVAHIMEQNLQATRLQLLDVYRD
jgi:CRP/FNR family cyclic AMP-dependent transcriptional regulator